MLLVTLGYDATKAGLVGVNWAPVPTHWLMKLACWMMLTLPSPVRARVSTLHS